MYQANGNNNNNNNNNGRNPSFASILRDRTRQHQSGLISGNRTPVDASRSPSPSPRFRASGLHASRVHDHDQLPLRNCGGLLNETHFLLKEAELRRKQHIFPLVLGSQRVDSYPLEKWGSDHTYVLGETSPNHPTDIASNTVYMASHVKTRTTIANEIGDYPGQRTDSGNIRDPDNNNNLRSGSSLTLSQNRQHNLSGSYSLASPSSIPDSPERTLESLLTIFYNSTRWPRRKDLSSQDNVLSSSRAVNGAMSKTVWDEKTNKYEDLSANMSPAKLIELVKEFSKMFGGGDNYYYYLLALLNGAWEFIYMYHRSLIGPALNGLLMGYDKQGRSSPFQVIRLPQKDPEQTVERHRVMEITQIQYNYTGLVNFGGYYGTASGGGGPAQFNHVPPSNSLFLMSDAESLQSELGYHIAFIRSSLVAKLAEELASFYTPSNFNSLVDYAKALSYFGEAPFIVKNVEKDLNKWLSDEEFGRQRLQGMNPEMITRVTSDKWPSLLHKLNLSAAVRKEMKEKYLKMEIEEAIAKGIIYVVDYSIMDDQEMKTLAFRSFQRYLAAPIALFYASSGVGSGDPKKLLPLGIQLNPLRVQASDNNNNNNKFNLNDPETQKQLAVDGFKFHMPAGDGKGNDAPAWLLAKIWVNSVDGQYQEIVSHLMETHQVGELISVAVYRNLAVPHPVYQLLTSHFEATLEVNTIAYGDLLAYDGAINQTIAAGSMGGALLISKIWKGWEFYGKSFRESLLERGFLDENYNPVKDGLDKYYWRTDGLELWGIIHRFVTSVLDQYYITNDDIVNDWELQNCIRELRDQKYGNMKNPTANGLMTTKEDLYIFCTNVIFTVTAKHSAGNSGQYDYYGFTPNVPGALYIPPNIDENNTTWNTIFKALPPKTPALNQMAIVYLLSQVKDLSVPLIGGGTYPVSKDQWAVHVKKFQDDLAKLSRTIQTREAGVPYPYTYLDPDNIGNSIYI